MEQPPAPSPPPPPLLAVAAASSSDGAATFLSTGICRLLEGGDDPPVVFLDPVRVLNHRSYARARVSASSYYSRSFPSPSSSSSRKRKRHRTDRELNERERLAERRHQELRPLFLRAHDALLRETSLLAILPDLVNDQEFGCGARGSGVTDFVALGKLWQAPMFEIGICPGVESGCSLDQGACQGQDSERTLVPVFNNLIFNSTADDVEVDFLESSYVLPRKCSFCMSDISQIRNLIPANSGNGYNLIVVDPPWENKSANQKAMYPILPNHYFLGLPIKQLASSEGALVVLWVTNREKLRIFVEKKLLTVWGVSKVATCHWLKVKMDGSMIGDLDLFHHRPYESFLLGYININNVESESTFTYPQSNQTFISIPGAYSRKPPIGQLLSDYIPGPKPHKCLELFARELHAGWTSWGNETLHFQDSKNFLDKSLCSSAV